VLAKFSQFLAKVLNGKRYMLGYFKMVINEQSPVTFKSINDVLGDLPLFCESSEQWYRTAM